jgi:hypothetical protein
MKTSMVVMAALAAAFLAGCDRGEPTAASKAPGASAPSTASGGASAGASKTGPAGDTSAQAPAAKPGGAMGETKPDPGDANDHSSPQHDAKSKKNGD